MFSLDAILIAGINFDSPQDIINNTKEISAEIDKALSVLWGFLGSKLFIEISNVAAIIAALGVGFWAIKWIKEVAKSDEFFYPDKIPQMAFGLMLAVLLGAPTERGKLLTDVLISYDRFTTNLSNIVLVAARPNPEKDPVASAQVSQAVRDRAAQDAKKCEKLGLLTQARFDCVDEAIERVSTSLEPYKEEWASKLHRELTSALGLLNDRAIGEAAKENIKRDFTLFAGDALNKVLIFVMFGLTVAFLVLLRVAKPLISIVFPLYIGLSYVPSSKPPVLWAIGMLIDIVLIEIIFKIFLSMIAQLALTLPLQIDTLTLGLLIVFGGIPFSIILGRRLSDGLTGAGVSAFPGLSRRFR
ncbi:hypothetical protein AM1_D0038 (plasmid) [Acaryochloris marina MBIC11017]|uniref:Uncharacterized protein n=2 Tax=Acaryochloris marina TaxID=155978 RepID=A8ZNE9_ACAM1|nr:hypothetical protein AM1_D0038 [Acaryochloris marina MBIC11017]